MKLENTMLLMSENDGAKVVHHPPASASDKKYRVSAGACFSHYKTLTNDHQVIHLLAYALFTLDRFSNLKAKDVIDELEKIEGLKDVIHKCLPSFN